MLSSPLTRLAASAQIIREDTPCHLYYDLEFSKLSNPGVSGEALVDKLIDLTADCFK